MNIFTAPKPINSRNFKQKSIFLAGSIEEGTAEKWQTKCAKILSKKYTIFNPRRGEWDDNWKQSIHTPEFYRQVSWELNGQEKADYILMYFDPKTRSPISLLELGLFAASQKMLVICPEGFWRKGNVDIVCEKYNIPQFENLQNALDYLMPLNK